MNEHGRVQAVARLQQGDLEAWQQLVVHYHQPLRRLVESQIDAQLRRRIDPDDVLQQAYVASFTKLNEQRFDGPAGFHGWLETIVLSKLHDAQRAAGRRKRDVAREISDAGAATSYPDLCHRLIGADTTPSHHLARDEAVGALMSSLARLSHEQREVIRLRYLEGWSVADVARHLDKTEPAVHMACHRGLKALRRLMVSLTDYLIRF
ncbi:MAG: sigma-70 family RNA polymerase sigma factor [Phycisphaerae bacterium]|jgi:RNA polymerase sigma-70 factor (ECF subfamily)